MKNLIKLMVIAIIAVAFTSCSEDPMNTNEDSISFKSTENPVMCKTNVYTLLAGQNINAGTVTVENDGINLYITVCSNEGFQDVAENIKILIGTESYMLNLTKRPAAGHFPYKFTVEPGNTCYSIPIPISDITGKEACSEDRIGIIVHADVIAEGNAETAFCGTKIGSGKAWWYFISYRIKCCIL